MNSNIITKSLRDSIEVKLNMLSDENLIEQIKIVAVGISTALQNGHRVFFAGNGGSAADAQHIAAELSGKFLMDRNPLPAEAMHCNTSYMTAVANDFGYEHVYERYVSANCSTGDVVVFISTSGESKNLILAAQMANNLNVTTVALTGANRSELEENCISTIHVPSFETPRIQEAHIAIGHIMCEIIESLLFDKDDVSDAIKESEHTITDGQLRSGIATPLK